MSEFSFADAFGESYLLQLRPLRVRSAINFSIPFGTQQPWEPNPLSKRVTITVTYDGDEENPSILMNVEGWGQRLFPGIYSFSIGEAAGCEFDADQLASGNINIEILEW